MSTFFVNGEPTFVDVQRSLPSNPPDYANLDICVFDNFILTEELFTKV